MGPRVHSDFGACMGAIASGASAASATAHNRAKPHRKRTAKAGLKKRLIIILLSASQYHNTIYYWTTIVSQFSSLGLGDVPVSAAEAFSTGAEYKSSCPVIWGVIAGKATP